MIKFIGFSDSFKLIHKEDVQIHFSNIAIYYSELEYIRTQLIKNEILRIFKNKKDNGIKIENRPLTANSKILPSVIQNLEFSMELSLFLKCYSFVWRQCLDEFLIILNELNFIYTKTGLKGNAPNRKFEKFLPQFLKHEYDHLDDKIIIFLNKNIKEITTMRFLRNNLKNDGKSLANFTFEDERLVVRMVHFIDKIDDKSLKEYFGSDIPFNANRMGIDLEDFLQNKSMIVKDFSTLLTITLTEKCIEIKYSKNSE
jgi:hypothetical protein